LDLVTVMGGVRLVVPEGWRVRFDGKGLLGGFSDETRTTADEDVPTITVTGLLMLGGLQATTRIPVRAAA
ncbi:MAG TPA: hypothetical protein VE569_08295, partial [Acidimicrobiia bacterium]|nr:hypothetical protein [Acidimicrobiia bacterium]